MADKLVAVRVKQQDNTYSNEIPIGAKAENVAYDNTKNLLQVLGTIDMYKGDVQTQLNALFEDFSGIAEDVAGAIDDWVTEHMPSWDPEEHLDDTLTADNLAPVSSAVPKLIAVNEAEIQGTKMKISTTGQEDLIILTPSDIDDTLSQQGEAADAKATGEMIMINNAATAGTKIRLVTTEEEIDFATKEDADNLVASLADEYDPTATYTVGKYCTYQYKLYKCTTAITTAEAWTAGHWTEVPLGTDLADQVGALKESINTLAGVEEIVNIVAGYGYNTTGTSIDINTPTANSALECAYTTCSAGDKFAYWGAGSSSYRNYVFLDSTGVILELGPTQHVENATLTAPVNSAFVVFNNLKNMYTFKATKGIVVEKQDKLTLDNSPTENSTNPVTSDGIYNACNAIDEKINLIANSMLNVEAVNGYTGASYWNSEGTTAVLASLSGWWAYNPIDVTPGEKYTITLYCGISDKQYPAAFVDENYTILSGHGERSNSVQTFDVVAPQNAKFLLLTTRYNQGTYTSVRKYGYVNVTELKEDFNALYTVTMKDNGVLSDLGITNLMECTESGYYRWGGNYSSEIIDMPVQNTLACMLFVYNPAFVTTATRYFVLQYLEDIHGIRYRRVLRNNLGTWSVYEDWVMIYDPHELKPLTGKKLSLLGDSISAMAGDIPSGNTAYYSGSNHGVTNASQMWYNVLCAKTGMVPLVINAWSGSGITQLEDSSHSSIPPMSGDARCNALGDGTNSPDVIIIAGGVNDYTYAQSAQSEPNAWDGKTVPIIGNSFNEAYACMIKKLQTNYPNAIIVALSTWFTMRGTNNGYTLTHAVGTNTYTQTDYNKAIESVCEIMHIPFIDVSNIGFNRNNFYPTYAEDSATTPTHPNAEGHKVMGTTVANKIRDLIFGFES